MLCTCCCICDNNAFCIVSTFKLWLNLQPANLDKMFRNLEGFSLSFGSFGQTLCRHHSSAQVRGKANQLIPPRQAGLGSPPLNVLVYSRNANDPSVRKTTGSYIAWREACFLNRKRGKRTSWIFTSRDQKRRGELLSFFALDSSGVTTLLWTLHLSVQQAAVCCGKSLMSLWNIHSERCEIAT